MLLLESQALLSSINPPAPAPRDNGPCSKTPRVSGKMKWLFSKTRYRKENVFYIIHFIHLYKHRFTSEGEVGFVCITRVLFGSAFWSSTIALLVLPFYTDGLQSFNSSLLQTEALHSVTSKVNKSSLCDTLQAPLQLTVFPNHNSGIWMGIHKAFNIRLYCTV